MKIINLVNGGQVQVDNEDFERVVNFGEWRQHNGYAVSVTALGSAPSTNKRITETTYMHRLILNLCDKEQTDHIDGNPFNNQKVNLRVVSHSENRSNSKMNRNNTSGYRGVTFSATPNPWRATFVHKGKVVNVGCFPTIEEAARAYDKRIKAVKGPFAKLNFPDE